MTTLPFPLPLRRTAAAALALLGAGCNGGRGTEPTPPPPEGEVRVTQRRTLVDAGGGRVAWHRGLNLIAFDHPAGLLAPDEYEVSVIRPDGGGRRCLTCNLPALPRGLRGQPAWHPSGEFLVIQAPNPQNVARSGVPPQSAYHGPGWGINQDLWLVGADGSWAERITSTPLNGAALHPQFSATGDRLFWSVREATGRGLGLPTPGGENPWEGWHLAVAAFQRSAAGGGATTLGAARRVGPGEGSFFESHHLDAERIWFSRTQAGRPYVDEGFLSAIDGSAAVNLTRDPRSWDEHVSPSPGGRLIAFNSSRGFPFDAQAGHSFAELQMELWVLPAQGGLPRAGAAPLRLTRANQEAPAGWHAVTSDYDWGPGGREVAVYYVYKEPPPSARIRRQRIDILTLDAAY